MCSSPSIISDVNDVTWLIIGNVDFDHLVKVVSANFLHSEDTILSFNQ